MADCFSTRSPFIFRVPKLLIRLWKRESLDPATLRQLLRRVDGVADHQSATRDVFVLNIYVEMAVRLDSWDLMGLRPANDYFNLGGAMFKGATSGKEAKPAFRPAAENTLVIE